MRFGVLSTKEVLTFDIKVEQRKNEVLIARAALFPELFVEATPATEDGNLAVGVVGLRYTIYSFGERTARISAARAVISQARYQVLTEIDEAVLKVAAQYVDLAVDTAQLSSARKLRAGM